MFKIVFLCVVGGLLAGCVYQQAVTEQSVSSLTNKEVHSSTDENKQELGVGMQIEISDPAYPQKVKAVIGEEYYSALGQHCFKVTFDQTSQSLQHSALCRKDSGGWALAPQIWPEAYTGLR